MKKSIPAVFISMFLCSPALATDDVMMDQGRAASNALGGALKQALQQAMKESGPVAAISVCNEKAPEIAVQLSEEQNMNIGRTALRVRNPANTPDAWEQEQLEAFVKRLASGESAENIESHATENGMFRYMKAIPMQDMCTTCHGNEETIPNSVKERIASLYPDDQATGFSPGDLRGAFTVSIPVDTTH